jgi:hypothetical protein
LAPFLARTANARHARVRAGHAVVRTVFARATALQLEQPVLANP